MMEYGSGYTYPSAPSTDTGPAGLVYDYHVPALLPLQACEIRDTAICINHTRLHPPNWAGVEQCQHFVHLFHGISDARSVAVNDGLVLELVLSNPVSLHGHSKMDDDSSCLKHNGC